MDRWAPNGRTAPGGCSEYTLRSSSGPDWEEAPLAGALGRLANVLEGGASPEERRLLGWMSREVPHHEIARALGIGRSGASQRVRRLRARLLAAATRHACHMNAHDRAELLRFFRRTGAYDDAELAHLEVEL